MPLLQEVSRGTPRNLLLPKKHRTSYPQVAIPALSEGTYTGGQVSAKQRVYVDYDDKVVS